MLAPEEADVPIALRRQRRAEVLGDDSCRFRELIGKLASGARSGRGLSREEAAEAIDRILSGRVTEGQAGAFLIAHRMRRPEPQELAGMIDSYRHHGPVLAPIPRPVISFGVPFDGRSRNAPLLPLTAMLLASAGLGVVLQGGDPMPVKYGLTHAEALAALGLELRPRPWWAVQADFERFGLALMHQPRHFPQAERLISIREQIGKRPPIATLELLWSCHHAPALQVSGFVHAPTEALAWGALQLVGLNNVLTLKGLEGGVDLPTSRVAIGAHWRGDGAERLLLRAREHGLGAREVELGNLAEWRAQALAALRGEGPLVPGLIWNGGVQLWRSGAADGLSDGLERAERLLREGAVEAWRRSMADHLLSGPTPEALLEAEGRRPRQEQRCFGFESDFVDDLRCIPMAVRRKLDLAGVKLKLVHWNGLAPAERQQLLSWPDDAAAMADLRQWLLLRSASLPGGPAKAIEPATATAWQQPDQLPCELLASCEQLGIPLRTERWAALGELERFALVKLSHPGHEHRNLERALLEFDLVEGSQVLG